MENYRACPALGSAHIRFVQHLFYCIADVQTVLLQSCCAHSHHQPFPNLPKFNRLFCDLQSIHSQISCISTQNFFSYPVHKETGKWWSKQYLPLPVAEVNIGLITFKICNLYSSIQIMVASAVLFFGLFSKEVYIHISKLAV